ncbi:MAG: hypothetical protein ACLTSX_03460 [Collinsella sp.]
MHSAGGVGALVELAGQASTAKTVAPARVGELVVGEVDLRLGEHGGHAGAEQLSVDALDVIAVDDAQARERLDAQGVAKLGEQLLRLDVKPGFFSTYSERPLSPALLSVRVGPSAAVARP